MSWLIPWHGIRKQCDRRSRVWILTTPYLMWKYLMLIHIHTLSPKGSRLRGPVWVYNICWGLNHQFKLFVEFPWYSFRSQRDRRSLVWISITSHLGWKYSAPICIHTSSPKGSRLRGLVSVYNIYWGLNHRLKLFVEFP